MHYIGKIDREIYTCVTQDIQTEDVIITSERIKHIQERHPNDYEKYVCYMAEAIQAPDFILEDRPNTALILKAFMNGEQKIRIVLRLATSYDAPQMKNSIITLMETGRKKWEQNLRTKKILYKRL